MGFQLLLGKKRLLKFQQFEQKKKKTMIKHQQMTIFGKSVKQIPLLLFIAGYIKQFLE